MRYLTTLVVLILATGNIVASHGVKGVKDPYIPSQLDVLGSHERPSQNSQQGKDKTNKEHPTDYDDTSFFQRFGHLIGIYGTLSPGSLPGEEEESLQHPRDPSENGSSDETSIGGADAPIYNEEHDDGVTMPPRETPRCPPFHPEHPGSQGQYPEHVPGGVTEQVTISSTYRPLEVPPRKITRIFNPDGSTTYSLLAITDMDMHTKTEKDWTWRAVIRRGNLTISADKKKVAILWDKSSDRNVTTGFNYKGRAMEMSDISLFGGRLLSPDDKTGMLYELKDGKAIPWVFLNSGDGNTTRGMKVEWLTIKHGLLYAGSFGVEFRDEEGNVIHEETMWIKTITTTGEVKSVNWKDNYDKLRNAANCSAPGYLTHEAVQWSEHLRKWIFLPRRASATIYKKEEDERKGARLLIFASESFEDIEIVEIGKKNIHPEKGYSAFEFIPDTFDEMIVALKTVELDDRLASFVTVFDIQGKIRMPEQRLEDNYKFEGIYFL